MTRWILPGLVFAAAVMFYVHRQRAAEQLVSENRTLARQISEFEQMVEENRVLSNQLAQASARKPLVNPQSEELERLRAESAEQKARIKELCGKHDSASESPDLSKLPFSIRCQELAKDSWSFAGYDTPEKALETMLWAAREGNLNALKDSITPDEWRRRMQTEWTNKTEEQIAADLRERISKAAGLQILKVEQLGSDTMHFTVYIDGIEAANQPVWMDVRQINGQWKADSLEHRVPGR